MRLGTGLTQTHLNSLTTTDRKCSNVPTANSETNELNRSVYNTWIHCYCQITRGNTKLSYTMWLCSSINYKITAISVAVTLLPRWTLCNQHQHTKLTEVMMYHIGSQRHQFINQPHSQIQLFSNSWLQTHQSGTSYHHGITVLHQ